MKKKLGIFSIFFLLFNLVVCTNVFGAISTVNYKVDGIAFNVDLLNQTPDPVRAGDIVELKFSIQNRGNESVNDLNVLLDYSYPFSAVPGEDISKTITKIFAYQSSDNAQIIKFKLFVDKDAPSGDYEVSLKLIRPDNNIISVYKSYVSVKGKEYAQVITINKSNIDFGKVENLQFLITNTGDAPIKNILFSWADPTGTILPVNSDNTKYVKNLDVNESILVDYNVMANINSAPGLYKLNLTLNFETKDYNSSILNTSAGIFVGGKTNFEVNFSEYSATRGVSISIANVGNNPAYSVLVSIPDQQGYKIKGSNSVMLGNLDKGDYTVATYMLSLTDTNAQKINDHFKVIVEYTDSLGYRNSIEKEIRLDLSSSIPNGATQNKNTNVWTSTTSLIIYAVILLAVIITLNHKHKNKTV